MKSNTWITRASGGETKAPGKSTTFRAAGVTRPDRGHHVPALTVTCGGRGVASDVACSELSSRGRERH